MLRAIVFFAPKFSILISNFKKETQMVHKEILYARYNAYVESRLYVIVMKTQEVWPSKDLKRFFEDRWGIVLLVENRAHILMYLDI